MTLLKINSSRPIGIDLFAGAGGLSLGFEQAGFDVVAAIDIDPIHSATHEFNFPKCVSICESATNLTGDSIRRKASLGATEIDVVFGGPPCQGFSMIGKRVFDDPRNSLVFHFVRLVKELSPKYFVFENVKGLTIGQHKVFLKELEQAFVEAGYSVAHPKVLNAADFGVPQNRHRLFMLGARSGLKLPQYPMSTLSTTVADAISDIPDADSFDELKKSDCMRIVFDTKSAYARRLRCLDKDPKDFGYPRKFDNALLTSSLRTEHTIESKQRFISAKGGTTESISRFFKLEPQGLCNTLRAGTDSARGAFTSPRPIHPYYPRVITVREAARLHSYPDWFRFHVTKWHGFRQVGNSVPPLLGRAVAAEIVTALGIKLSKPEVALELVKDFLLAMNMSEAASYYSVARDVIPQRTREDGMENRYVSILSEVFRSHYKKGLTEFKFTRTEFETKAAELGIKLPKNIGDVIYSFRYRVELPESIKSTARKGFEWCIIGAGKAEYQFKQLKPCPVVPREGLIVTKIPDSTPEIITAYAQSDEQALLAKVRYNRLIDIFLGITTYSLQNHMRTTVTGMGQIEIDEIYVGIDKHGRQYVIPVQAKGGKDKHGMVQTLQDIACCAEKFPTLICRPISAQFMSEGRIALFELTFERGEMKIVEEKHYSLVPSAEISTDDLRRYSTRTT